MLGRVYGDALWVSHMQTFPHAAPAPTICPTLPLARFTSRAERHCASIIKNICMFIIVGFFVVALSLSRELRPTRACINLRADVPLQAWTCFPAQLLCKVVGHPPSGYHVMHSHNARAWRCFNSACIRGQPFGCCTSHALCYGYTCADWVARCVAKKYAWLCQCSDPSLKGMPMKGMFFEMRFGIPENDN